MEYYELEAWLGDFHSELDDDQFNELLDAANEIENRYPDNDDQQEALTVAYRLMFEPVEDVVNELAGKLSSARASEAEALVALEQAALILAPKVWSENSFANVAGVDRMTVRKWLGKRSSPAVAGGDRS